MRQIVIIVMGMIITSGCASSHMKPTVHGIDNFGEVVPGIFRGGQPASADGWYFLKELGVTNVVKLNTSAEGIDPAKAFAVHAFPIPLSRQIIFEPDETTVAGAVAAIKPGTFIHCTHGQDRTGLIIGEYRVRKCGWTKKQAREEMRAYGFHPILFGLESFWEDDK